MNLHGRDIKIFAANASKNFAKAMANYLGLPMGKSEVKSFADGETSISILESARGSDVYVVQSTSSPVNENLMELLLMIDAFKRASAGRITAVIPYFGYARQDRKSKSREPISAKLVADLITTAGADRVLTMDLHSPQIQGFFNIPLDNLLGVPSVIPFLVKKFQDRMDELVVVSPDVGSISRASALAGRLHNVPLAILDKRRPAPNISEVFNIIGDVKDKLVVIYDDIIDTGGTLCNAVEAVMKHGAKSVTVCATHAVLSKSAIDLIENSQIEELVILDTIELPEEKHIDKISVISVAPVFAEAVARIYSDKPMSSLFY